jgi:hypothetical protein
MDRVALIKSKQQANALFNGSTIQSDIIILTEQSQSGTKINSQEIIKEQTMGFVQGLENLLKFDFNEKKIFVYYRVLDSKQ